MDPETEKHFAALIMEEAARLRLQADKEGVHAYLAKPTVRGKPNPQFLKATVRGIAQANRAAEVSGMWKRRALELELEEREKKRSRHGHRSDVNTKYLDRSPYSSHSKTKKATSGHRNPHQSSSPPRLCSKNAADSISEDYKDGNLFQSFEDDLGDQGLREEEVEQFLQSRVKRGRGAVGSRMDETGPYPSAHSVGEDFSNVRIKEEWEQHIIGPSTGYGERHPPINSKIHRVKKEKVGEGECTSSHKTEKREKKKRKHRHLHKHRSSRKRSDAL